MKTYDAGFTAGQVVFFNDKHAKDGKFDKKGGGVGKKAPKSAPKKPAKNPVKTGVSGGGKSMDWYDKLKAKQAKSRARLERAAKIAHVKWAKAGWPSTGPLAVAQYKTMRAMIDANPMSMRERAGYSGDEAPAATKHDLKVVMAKVAGKMANKGTYANGIVAGQKLAQGK